MNVFKLILVLFAAAFTLSSCGPKLTPFTQKLYDQNDWSEDELKKVQFYLSDDVKLLRQNVEDSTKIEKGEIQIMGGREVEEVLIRKGTPGVLLFLPKENRFAISFEEEGDERYLVFGPSPKMGGRYVLLAREWRKKRGIVTYEDKEYAVDFESAYSNLMVDLKKIRKFTVDTRKAGGRKITE